VLEPVRLGAVSFDQGRHQVNVFGPRQNANGAYAAVIPHRTAALLKGAPVHISGEGESSRDFCCIANAVQANLLAAVAEADEAKNQIYNVAGNGRTTLNTLLILLRDSPRAHGIQPDVVPVYRDFRAGDVRHSQADISKASNALGYQPSHTVTQRIAVASESYTENKKLLQA
jgi:UDP-N-acetylglucosamine/UDP-N-acetylgalactosamine 4-epimerase